MTEYFWDQFAKVYLAVLMAMPIVGIVGVIIVFIIEAIR